MIHYQILIPNPSLNKAQSKQGLNLESCSSLLKSERDENQSAARPVSWRQAYKEDEQWPRGDKRPRGDTTT